MDVVQCLEEAYENLAEKQRLGLSKTLELIDGLLGDLVAAKEEITDGVRAEGPGFKPQAALKTLGAKVVDKGVLQQASEIQKASNNAAGKLGKVVEKHFSTDIAKAYREVPEDQEVLNLELLRHLYREGLVEEGDCYAKEADVTGGENLRDKFGKLHYIVKEMKEQNVTPALTWAQEHRLEIMLKGSGMSLEFGLHKLQFLHVLTQNGRAAGLAYARSHFAPFGSSHMAEIQRFMGALLWADKLHESPYADLLGAMHWEDMAQQFTLEYLSVMGEASRNPLGSVVAAGGHALPMLLKLATLMSSRPQEWQTMKQLPVEIELGRNFQFHSIFACPVSREQSSVENPPMLLPCCHVLCKFSILKLSKSPQRPFKCPYCPMETNPGSCRPIQF